MPQFTCRGWLKLNGVIFSVSAENEEEARKKFEAGDWTDWDTTCAEGADWDLDTKHIES